MGRKEVTIRKKGTQTEPSSTVPEMAQLTEILLVSDTNMQ
jgi:hypothetical protein